MSSNSKQENYWARTTSHRTSRRGLIRGAGIVGAGLTGAALIGCGDDDEAPSPMRTPAPGAATPAPSGATPSGDGPRQGGTLGWFQTSPPQNFNIVANGFQGYWMAGAHVYDHPITSRVDERVYVLEAAESVELVDDTTVVMRLKDGLVYQDRPPVNGRPVTVDDIARMQEYARDAPIAHNNSFQLNSLDSVQTPDDRTVVYTLTRPNAYLLTGTQMGHPGGNSIVPRELLDDLDSMEPVGSGPYQLKEHQFGVRHLYERNPTFREAAEGRPYIDERLILELPDGAAQEAAFRNEQMHVYIPAAVETADRLIQDLGDRITVDEYVGLDNFTTGMSAEREQWNDIRVREAYYRLLNKQQFIDLVDVGKAVPATGFLARGLERYQVPEADVAEFWRHDPQEARQLLDAAGFDFERHYELVTFVNPRMETAVQVLARQLQEVGIRTDVSVTPIGEYLGPIMNTGRFDMAINQHPAFDSPQMQLRWHHSDPQTIISSMNLRDPEVDAMIEESEVLLDPDAHEELVKRIQVELLRRYARFIQINTRVVQNLRWGYVRDWEINPSTIHIMYRTEAWMDI